MVALGAGLAAGVRVGVVDGEVLVGCLSWPAGLAAARTGLGK